MSDREPNVSTTLDARAWARILARYREPSCARSIFELIITVVPLVLLWILMWAILDSGYWLCLLLALPAAGFVELVAGFSSYQPERVDQESKIKGNVVLPQRLWLPRVTEATVGHAEVLGRPDHT